jgi:hypothetical protein
VVVKKAADEPKQLISGCVWMTRNRLCTELSTGIGEKLFAIAAFRSSAGSAKGDERRAEFFHEMEAYRYA